MIDSDILDNLANLSPEELAEFLRLFKKVTRSRRLDNQIWLVATEEPVDGPSLINGLPNQGEQNHE